MTRDTIRETTSVLDDGMHVHMHAVFLGAPGSVQRVMKIIKEVVIIFLAGC